MLELHCYNEMYTDSQIYVCVCTTGAAQDLSVFIYSTINLVFEACIWESLMLTYGTARPRPARPGAGTGIYGCVEGHEATKCPNILVGGVYICMLTEGHHHVFAVFLAARREGSVPSRMDWHASTVPGCGAGANGRPNFAKDTLRKVWERRRSLRQVAPHVVQNSGQAGLVSAGVARILCSYVPRSERGGSLRGRTQS